MNLTKELEQIGALPIPSIDTDERTAEYAERSTIALEGIEKHLRPRKRSNNTGGYNPDDYIVKEDVCMYFEDETFCDVFCPTCKANGAKYENTVSGVDRLLSVSVPLAIGYGVAITASIATAFVAVPLALGASYWGMTKGNSILVEDEEVELLEHKETSDEVIEREKSKKTLPATSFWETMNENEREIARLQAKIDKFQTL